MSSYRRDDRRDRDSYSSSRRDSRDRRRSPGPSSSSRRSPSPPPPRSDKELPEAFGRVADSVKDDDTNVLQRMQKKFVNAPLGSLTKCLEGCRKIKVWTRNFKEVRGICTGYVVAFDKHWNIIMTDVDEVYLKPRKSKTPFLDDIRSAENFAELPKKEPKKKKVAQPAEPPPPPIVKQEVVEGEEKGKKKKKRSKKKKNNPSTQKRHVKQLFVRGDNIVMAAILEESDNEEN